MSDFTKVWIKDTFKTKNLTYDEHMYLTLRLHMLDTLGSRLPTKQEIGSIKKIIYPSLFQEIKLRVKLFISRFIYRIVNRKAIKIVKNAKPANTWEEL
jgi:hypothetical protein